MSHAGQGRRRREWEGKLNLVSEHGSTNVYTLHPQSGRSQMIDFVRTK